jgi:hypothetical protein
LTLQLVSSTLQLVSSKPSPFKSHWIFQMQLLKRPQVQGARSSMR